jgi:hypothetical protein
LGLLKMILPKLRRERIINEKADEFKRGLEAGVQR